jgi:ribosomal protein L11 methyltransferase
MMSLWKISLPCCKADVDALEVNSDAFGDFASPPAIITSLPDDNQQDAWLIEAYLDVQPDAKMQARFASLSSQNIKPCVEEIADQDWLKLSQEGLQPISAGRYYIHTEHYADAVPGGAYALQIAGGQAFGTGSHATTTGCLLTLDKLTRGKRFHNVLDLGTGTGILIFAVARHWRSARMVASDIDAPSIDVAIENAQVNHIVLGRRCGGVELLAASGLHDRRLRQRAPYDLLIANILAGPLIALSPSISRAVKRNGILILAGLLATQEAAVGAAYASRGFVRVGRRQIGDWPTLMLRKRYGR